MPGSLVGIQLLPQPPGRDTITPVAFIASLCMTREGVISLFLWATCLSECISEFFSLFDYAYYVPGIMSQKCIYPRTSLVAQWLRVRLPMQGTRVRALVQEDPTCHRATKPVHHNY